MHCKDCMQGLCNQQMVGARKVRAAARIHYGHGCTPQQMWQVPDTQWPCTTWRWVCAWAVCSTVDLRTPVGSRRLAQVPVMGVTTCVCDGLVPCSLHSVHMGQGGTWGRGGGCQAKEECAPFSVHNPCS